MDMNMYSNRLIALIAPEMTAWLKEQSALCPCSVAEVVRQAIQAQMTGTSVEPAIQKVYKALPLLVPEVSVQCPRCKADVSVRSNHDQECCQRCGADFDTEIQKGAEVEP